MGLTWMMASVGLIPGRVFRTDVSSSRLIWIMSLWKQHNCSIRLSVLSTVCLSRSSCLSIIQQLPITICLSSVCVYMYVYFSPSICLTRINHRSVIYLSDTHITHVIHTYTCRTHTHHTCSMYTRHTKPYTLRTHTRDTLLSHTHSTYTRHTKPYTHHKNSTHTHIIASRILEELK